MRGLVLILTVFIGGVLAELKFIDLTHTFGKKTVYWPTNPPFNFSVAFEIPLGDKYIAVSNYFQTAEHSGTHMDAPQHFCPGALMVHQIPLHKMSGPGVLMDFTAQATQDYDYQVSLQDVQNWEAKHGLVPTGAIVLLKFGWDKYWPDWEKVFNSNTFNDTSTFHFPALGIEASRYLSGTRKIHAVGLDTPSIDNGQSRTFEVHINLLCDHGIIILESVANLDAMPPTGTHVYIGAIKLENGSGTPVRLFATQDDERDPSRAREVTLNSLCVSLLLSTIMISLTDVIGFRI